MTISHEREAQILRLYHVERWRVGTIARQLGLHHATVSRVLAQAGLPALGRPLRASKIDPYSPRCSSTMRTARSRTSGENLFDLFMAPFSQMLEPPQTRGVFTEP